MGAFDLPMPSNDSEGADSERDSCCTSVAGKVVNSVNQPDVRVKAGTAALVMSDMTPHAAMLQVHRATQGTWRLPSHPFFSLVQYILKLNAKSA